MPIAKHNGQYYTCSKSSVFKYCAMGQVGVTRTVEPSPYLVVHEPMGDLIAKLPKVMYRNSTEYAALLIYDGGLRTPAAKEIAQLVQQQLGWVGRSLSGPNDFTMYIMHDPNMARTDPEHALKLMPAIPTKEEGQVYADIIGRWWHLSKDDSFGLDTIGQLYTCERSQQALHALGAGYSSRHQKGRTVRAKNHFCETGRGAYYGPARYATRNHSSLPGLPWWSSDRFVTMKDRFRALDHHLPEAGITGIGDHWDLFTPCPWEMYPLIWEFTRRQVAGEKYITVGRNKIYFKLVFGVLPNPNHGNQNTSYVVLSRDPITLEDMT